MVNAALTQLGILIRGPDPDLIQQSRFTWTNSYFGTETTEIIYKLLPNGFHVIPRGVYTEQPSIIKLPPNIRPHVLQRDPQYEMTPNQRVIATHLWDNYLSKPSCGLTLQAETGEGKTLIAIMLVKRRRARALVILPDTVAVEQWDRGFKKFLPSAVVNAHLPKRKHCEDEDVTLMTIHLAMKKKLEYFKRFGFIVYDEVHEYASPKRTKIFTRASSRWMLAMTASPFDRADERDEAYIKLVGPLIEADTLEGYNRNEVQFNGVVRVIRYFNPPEYSGHSINEESGEISHFKTIQEKLIPDDERCRVILHEVKLLYQRGEHILVPANIIELLEKLHRMAQESGDFENIAVLHSATITEDELRKAVSHYRVLFVISNIFRKAISLSLKTSMVLGNPLRSGMRQLIGRITRRDYNPEHPRTVVDILDMRIPMFVSQFQSKKKVCRLDEYKRRGFAIEYHSPPQF